MGWNRGRELGRRHNVDTGKKAADNSSGLFSGLELMLLDYSIDRLRESLEGKVAYNQKHPELPLLFSAVFILHSTCKGAP